MMMAELVQGQASVAQSGTKADGFADALHRARQVIHYNEEKPNDFRRETNKTILRGGGVHFFLPAHPQNPLYSKKHFSRIYS